MQEKKLGTSALSSHLFFCFSSCSEIVIAQDVQPRYRGSFIGKIPSFQSMKFSWSVSLILFSIFDRSFAASVEFETKQAVVLAVVLGSIGAVIGAVCSDRRQHPGERYGSIDSLLF